MPQGISAFASSAANDGPDVHRFDGLVDHTDSLHNIAERPMLGLLRSMPHSLLLRAGSYVLAFLIGMGIGNYDATKRALNRQLEEERQAAANQQREYTAHLIAYQKDVETKLKQRAAVEKAADAAAYKVIQYGMEEAGKARETALRALEQEKRLNNDLRTVNAMLADEMAKPDPGCVMPSRVRNIINAAIATANANSSGGDPEAAAAAFLDGPNSSTQVLTCHELELGLVDLLEHDAVLVALIKSWQQWAREALR